MAGVAEASELDDLEVIRLRLGVERSGGFFLMVAPPRTKLWRDTPDRPWMIRWKVADNGLYGDLYWVIRYDSDSDAASNDYFGDIDIACGERGMDVVPEMKPEEPNATWPYKVTVHLCVDGVKGPAKETLNAKPKIIWRN